jgi:hypothetical protein
MDEPLKTGVCSVCGQKLPTNMYHGALEHYAADEKAGNAGESFVRKVELCRECFDQVLAREQVNYWKEHIAEEQRRFGSKR